MSKLHRLLTLKINQYRKNNKKFNEMYSDIFKSGMSNEFNNIKVGTEHVLLNIILDNIKNSNHCTIKKYPSIVRFIKKYKDNYVDDLHIFLDDVDNYHNYRIDYDIFFSLYDKFTQETSEIIKNFELSTFNMLNSNVHLLINNNLSRSDIISQLNNDYVQCKSFKLYAMYEISVYLLDLYFKYNKQTDSFKFRYGQKEAYDIFKQKLQLPKYWGLMIAPTGWGKSMMHYIFIGYFFQKFNKNILLITKRKDILLGVIKEIKKSIKKLKENKMFPSVEIEICDTVSNKLNYKTINKCFEYSIIIVNSDKLITRDKDDDKFDPTTLNKIKWNNFGLVIFDESHWAGSKRTLQFMDYLKHKISFGIGSSATPVRRNLQNQENMQKLYGDGYDIMYELSYMDAWTNNVILRVDIIMFPIFSEEYIGKNKNNNFECDIRNSDKKTIISTIKKVLKKSYKKKLIMYFRSRMSLLNWYSYLKDNDYFDKLTYHVSFTYSGSVNSDTDSDDEENMSLDHQVVKKISELDIDFDDIDNGIDNFKMKESNAILFVVNRANEGFDDKFVDICVNLDFSKNRSMLLTLQKMGRVQRVCKDKENGYYICPVISSNKEEFKNIIAQSQYDYIKAISDNSVKYGKYKSIPAELMREIIENFKIEGIDNYTHDDIMKRIRQLEKEKNMTLQQFIENLKTYEITSHESYCEVWRKDEEFKDLGMPQFYNSIEGFCWELVNDDDYYESDQIEAVLKKIYCKHRNHLNKLEYNQKKLNYICTLDKKIPCEFPWLYYNLSRNTFSFIFNQ